jgi:hypothetical protein
MRRVSKVAVVIAVALTLALPLATASASVPSAALAVPLADGAGKPTPGSGMATKAALENPRCTVNDRTGPYGRFNGPTVGGGPVCVRPFAADADNGGATAPGVTKDKISVVYVLGHIPETRAQPPVDASTGQTGTDEDAVHDLLLAMRPYYETWGRDVDVKFFTSSGEDESAQRADAVAIKGMKPFAVVNTHNSGLGVLAAELAKAKILTYDAETSYKDAATFSPYLWGAGTEPQTAAINTAEFAGKQLVGKKAEYAAGDVKDEPRKFALISKDGDIDVAGFKKALAKYKGTIVSEFTYPPIGGAYGDATIAQENAPTMVARMKADGVTTVLLFTDAALNKALMEQATSQDWYPEWVHTGNAYSDYSAFSSTYPKDQAAHFFGISGLPPYFEPPTDADTAAKGALGNNLDWFWGPNNYTRTARVLNGATWLMQGIQAAGPDLTPKNFLQGQFAVPAVGGSASDTPLGFMLGYGKTAGLPYDQYNRASLDFSVMWLAPDIEAPDATGVAKKPSLQFLNNGQRYRAGAWPTKKFAFFDESKSIGAFETPPPGYVQPTRGACSGCPSSGALSPTPGTPSKDGFVVPVPASTSS